MKLCCAKPYVKSRVYADERTGLYHHHLHHPSEQLTSAKPLTLTFCYY